MGICTYTLFQGMLSWWSILPLDVIKSRVQGDCPHNPQYKGMIHCATIIWKSQGVRFTFLYSYTI